MKIISLKNLLLIAIVVLFVSCTQENEAKEILKEEFENPPQPAKPWVYWINMDGHFTKEGITADLESMKDMIDNNFC